jgi:DNA polymerase elongation subunit (family B)
MSLQEIRSGKYEDYEVWDEETNEWKSYEKSCYVKVVGGFPEPSKAEEAILLITLQNNQTKEFITWSKKRFDINEARALKEETGFDIDAIQLDFRHFPDECDMLRDFLLWWRNAKIDCLTDWNGDGFDIPYIVNRITKLLGADAALQLSPFRKVKERTVEMGERSFITYDLLGIAHLDYLQLYKKFGSYNAKESYKLDFIANEELGVKKLDMGCSFKDSYKDENYSKFILYNLRDVELVDKLEDKMGLIQLAYTIAYDAKCLPNDVFGAVKTWDCMMYRFMLEKKIVIPQKKHVESRHIEGAYVKEPKPGFYEWIASVDAASLYPTIIMQYNMSPETLVEIPMRKLTVDGLLNNEYDFSDLKSMNYGIAANGQCFDNSTPGLFPEIVDKQFSDRKKYKKMMKEAETQLELVKSEMKKRGLSVI